MRLPPYPSTTTILAFGFLAGCFLFTPMIAVVGKHIPVEFRDAVMTMAGLFKDGMLLILGYYFSTIVRGAVDEVRIANTASDPVPVEETK